MGEVDVRNFLLNAYLTPAHGTCNYPMRPTTYIIGGIIATAVTLAVIYFWFSATSRPAPGGEKTTEAQRTELKARAVTSGEVYRGGDADLARRDPAVEVVPIAPLKDALIEKRQEYYDSLSKQNAWWLFGQWRTVVNGTDDPTTRGLTSRALSFRLQNEPNEKAFYSEARLFLADSTSTLDSKIDLIRILGRAATAEALQLLLSLAGNVRENAAIEAELNFQIAKIGESKWENRFHSELTDLYLHTLSTAPPDSPLSKAAMLGLASVGSPSGITYLVSDISSRVRSVEELNSRHNDERLTAGLDALNRIRNPDAIPVLSKGLESGRGVYVDLIISGTALSAMGEPKATAALLKWAQTASDDVAPYARQWFSQTRDTASFDLIEATLRQQTAFTSARVKAEVQAVLNDRNGRLMGTSGR